MAGVYESIYRAMEEEARKKEEEARKKAAAEAVLRDLVQRCECCSARSSQRKLVSVDGAILCLPCYQDLTGKPYEPPKPTPKPQNFGVWS